MKNLVIYEGFLETLGSNVTIKTIRNFEDFKSGIRVFCASPFNEILTDEDCKKEYDQYDNNGIVFAAYVNNEIVGLNCILNEVKPEYKIGFYDKDKVAYYAGLATRDIKLDNKERLRGKGVGKLLVKTTEDYLENLNKYDYSFARIQIGISQSEGIFRKNGFVDAYDNGILIVEDVSYERSNTKEIQSDKRKYMVKTLNPAGNGWYSKK